MLPDVPHDKAAAGRDTGVVPLDRHSRRVGIALVARDVASGSAGSAVAGLVVSLASHSTAAGVAAGALVWVVAGAGIALRTWWRQFRNTPGVEVDPWALPEPWRQLVADAVASERRFGAAAASMPGGPLRDEVVGMEPTVHVQVLRVWDAARQGAALTGGYPAGARTENASVLAARLREVQEQRVGGGGAEGGGAQLDRAEHALAAQLRETRRADAVAEGILAGLRAALARLDSAVTSLAELASDAAVEGGPEAGAPSVDSVGADLVALRSGLDGVASTLPGSGALGPG